MHSHGGRYVRHPPDKCAALKTCRAFFGVGTFPCKNITGDHFQPASQRTGAALSSRFLIPPSYNVGRRPLVGPLRKAAWSSGSSWPNRPGDHSTRKRTWWGRPLGDFQGRINPRLIQTDALPACRLRFAREAHTCQVGNRAQSFRGYLSLPIAFVRSSK